MHNVEATSPSGDSHRYEFKALCDHRLACRVAWLEALSDLHGHVAGGHPTVAQYERLERLLASLKVAQRRIDDFAARSVHA